MNILPAAPVTVQVPANLIPAATEDAQAFYAAKLADPGQLMVLKNLHAQSEKGAYLIAPDISSDNKLLLAAVLMTASTMPEPTLPPNTIVQISKLYAAVAEPSGRYSILYGQVGKITEVANLSDAVNIARNVPRPAFTYSHAEKRMLPNPATAEAIAATLKPM